MCFGSSPKPQPMPPTPPATPTMADPAVQTARNDAQETAARETGLSGTNLTVNLGGQGKGVKNLAATA